MKLCINSKTIYRYIVKDEQQNDLFLARRKILSIPPKLYVCDKNGHEIACIREKGFIFPVYLIEINGAAIIKFSRNYSFKLTFSSAKFRLDGVNWELLHDNFQEYSLWNSDKVIMSFCEKQNWRYHSWEVNINEPKYTLLCICIILALDMESNKGAGG
jgi:uncharacterized protein YxjI